MNAQDRYDRTNTKQFNMFNENPSIELSAMMSDLALTLVNHCGLTWEDIESLETA